MTGKVKVGVAIAAPILVLLALGTTLWLNRPFQAELASYRTSLADRTEAQRHNIRQAVKILDGEVIEPGETFSFNDLVGPRTPERGYQDAPAFMERDLVTSVGGGICQVSSSIYNTALLAGLKPVERHPHFRVVASVPPGRDASVWYGASDLKIRNSFSRAVRISLRMRDEALEVTICGHAANSQDIRLQVEPVLDQRPGWRSYRSVRIYTNSGGATRSELLTVDAYRTP